MLLTRMNERKEGLLTGVMDFMVVSRKVSGSKNSESIERTYELRESRTSSV